MLGCVGGGVRGSDGQGGGEEQDVKAEVRNHVEALRQLLAQARAVFPPGDHQRVLDEMRRTLEAAWPRRER